MRPQLKIIILITLAGFLIFNQAYADLGGWLGGIAFGGIIWALNGIFYIIGMIGAALFSLGAALIQLALILNTEITQSPMVRIGWRITRDIANLGFVVGILVIAFSTMLRLESYGMKKTLAKLVTAALLVNFSLALATPILDVSHLFTNFFITKAAGPTPTSAGGVIGKLDGFVSNLSAAFQPQGLLAIKDDIRAFEGTAAEAGNKFIEAVLNYFFLATFTFLAADTVLALVIMMFYRYVALSILLIILPLAVLMWVFPGLQNYWQEWWKKFISQTLFLPISLFFVYLAIVMVSQKAGLAPLQTVQGTQVGQAFGGFANIMKAPFATLGQMLTVLGLLMGGLFVAKRMGAVGASASISLATGLRNFALGALVARPLSWAAGQLGEGRLGQFLNRTREELAKTQAAGARLGRPATQLRAALVGEAPFGTSKRTDRREDKKLDRSALIRQYNNLSSADRLKLTQDKALLNDPLKAGALLAAIAQNGELESLVDDDFNLLKETAKKNGDRTILKYMPHLAGEFGTTIKDVIGGLKPEEFDKISHRSLADIDVVSELTAAQIERFGAAGTNKQREAIVGSILENIDNKSGAERDKLSSLVETMVRGKGASRLAWSGTNRIQELTQKITQAPLPPIVIPPETTKPPIAQAPAASPAPVIDLKIAAKIQDKEFIIGKIKEDIANLERTRATQPEPVWMKLKSDQEKNLSRASDDLQKLKTSLSPEVKFGGPKAPAVAAAAPPPPPVAKPQEPSG